MVVLLSYVLRFFRGNESGFLTVYVLVAGSRSNTTCDAWIMGSAS